MARLLFFSTYRMIKRLHSRCGEVHFLELPLQTAGERQSSAYGGVRTRGCTRYNPIYSAGNAAALIQREERFSRVQPEGQYKVSRCFNGARDGNYLSL